MDAKLLELCTASVQAQEQLQFHLKHRTPQDGAPEPTTPSVIQDSGKILDQLRELRSQITGTAVTFEKTLVSETALQLLKQLTLMHVPSSLTDDVKQKMTHLVREVFQGSVKKVLFCGLVTCPWYLSTQTDRGLQARHNSLIIIYLNDNSKFFAPVNPHDREKAEVVDLGWFYAAEMFHFAEHMLRGKVRFVELLFLMETSEVYEDVEWQRLMQCLRRQEVSKLRGFMEQCRGQAVGGVGRKSKRGGNMKLRDSATLYEFCESFRLLQHASQVLANQDLSLHNTDCPTAAEHSNRALHQLQNAYKEDGITKVQLFETVMAWRSYVDDAMKGIKWTPPDAVEQKLGGWMSIARKGNHGISTPVDSSAIGIDPGEEAKLEELMRDIGGAVAEMHPSQILMVARAGSQLYGLANAQSDVDYIVIYADPVEKLLCSCHRLSESIESRGPAKKVEYGAYEARLFAEMVWKGSVVIAELVFVDQLDYMSESWKSLVFHRHLLMTERLILQYIGLIKNNFHMIENGRHKDGSREKKLFYQIFHKLANLEYMARGEIPPIRCSGQTKEFIMRIRQEPLEGDLSRDTLYKLAKDKMVKLQETLANRIQRLPEDVNYDFLSEWIMSVRGFGQRPVGYQVRDSMKPGDNAAANQTNEPLPLLAPEDNFTILPNNFVFFDVETTGLDINSEIIQISAITTTNNIFDRYILPKRSIPRQVTQVNGLQVNGDMLLYKDRPVDAGKAQDVLEDFLRWLPIDTLLFAHNASFDARMLTQNCRKQHLLDLLCGKVAGFCDTLPIFREVFPGQVNYKQQTLVTNVLKEEYDAHNAAADVSTLCKLFNRSAASEEVISKNCFSVATALYKTKLLENKKKNISSYENINVIAKTSIEQLSQQGLALSHLRAAVQTSGLSGLVNLLNGRVKRHEKVAEKLFPVLMES